MAIRVVVAEDSLLVREGLRELLAASPSVDVVASYGDGFLTGGLVAVLGVAAAVFVRSSGKREEAPPEERPVRD